MIVAQMNNYTLVSTDIEVQGILSYLQPDSEKLQVLVDKYPILFIKSNEGDINEVYGCMSNIPYLCSEVELLYLKYSENEEH